MAISQWDIWERAETGPIVSTKQFDTKIIFRKAQELVKKYDIMYAPDSVVPTDDVLIDKVWQAGVGLPRGWRAVPGHAEAHQVHRAGDPRYHPVCPLGGRAGGGHGRGGRGPQGHRRQPAADTYRGSDWLPHVRRYRSESL